MKCEINVTKDDLKFANIVQKNNLGYSCGCIHVVKKENEILFEGTDLHILVRMSFPIAETTGEEVRRNLKFSPEFFKRVVFLCKQKEVIKITVDFENRKITGETSICTITSDHIVTCGDFPNTDEVFQDKEISDYIVFKKENLERFLNSIPNSHEYVKFNIPCDHNAALGLKSPIEIKSSKKIDDWTRGPNLIIES